MPSAVEACAKPMGARRFELRTSPLSGVRSSQLSYAPVATKARPILVIRRSESTTLESARDNFAARVGHHLVGPPVRKRTIRRACLILSVLGHCDSPEVQTQAEPWAVFPPMTFTRTYARNSLYATADKWSRSTSGSITSTSAPKLKIQA